MRHSQFASEGVLRIVKKGRDSSAAQLVKLDEAINVLVEVEEACRLVWQECICVES